MGKTVFFLRAYNDIDHMTPIIWKFIKKGHIPIVVFHTDISYEDDYRFRFLRDEGAIEIYNLPDEEYIKYEKKIGHIIYKFRQKVYRLKRDKKGLIGRYVRRNFDCSEEIRFLAENNVSQCIFEWGTPYIRGENIEKFFLAAKGLGITTFCLPHGCNVFTHPDVNKSYREKILRGVIPDQSARREYDYYVFQNPILRDGWVRWGYDPVKTFAWGSTRYCPQWQEINLQICPKYEPKIDHGGSLKVVFMQFQSNYNLNTDEIWKTLNLLAEDDRIQLVIKKSTRFDKDYESSQFSKKYQNSPRIEFVDNNVHSPALIQWSDCVISFGSSIGMEVLLQNKPLINPTYMFSNRTLYEKYGAALSASSKEEVINYIEDIIRDKTYNVPKENKELIYKEIIYAGQDEHDVLESYYSKINETNLHY